MTIALKNLLKERKSDAIQDEIRKRVLARYSELQGIESEKSELEATLDALQEMTGLSKHEIDNIAREVQEHHAGKENSIVKVPQTSLNKAAELGLTFDYFNKKADAQIKGFIYHLIPFGMVNATLIILNAITSSFPWAMFPLFFWGIGLASHFIGSVYWPRKARKRKIVTLQTQVHQILSEKSPAYLNGSRPDLFQGLYRLTMLQTSKENLEEYLRNAEAGFSEGDIKQISTQISALQ